MESCLRHLVPLEGVEGASVTVARALPSSDVYLWPLGYGYLFVTKAATKCASGSAWARGGSSF